ncbi:MAG: hypothetical protein OEY85_13170, partial [Rhodospirillales bacterium]|nr:hypothetical protein [Rhodospirillales bacterium]
DATLEQAFRARDLGQMLGLIEAIPIVPLLNKLAPETRGQTMRLLMDAMKSGTEAGLKEAATVLGENLIASDFVRYDPERKAHVAVVDGATVSFTAGTIFEMLDHVFAK